MMRPLLSILMTALPALAQAPGAPAPAPKPNRTFTVEAQSRHTAVKSQDKSGTCWSFATTSFFESELLRLGKGEVGLSEMFVARKAWPHKARHYFRMQGAAPWSPGGQAHDWIDMAKLHGLVPRDSYSGLVKGEVAHAHGEMDAASKGLMDAVVKAKPPTTRWPAALDGLLDAYLGSVPATFSFQGRSHTPVSFRDSLGLDLDAYVELTSFSHHPFYRAFRLEIPDNWSQDGRYLNLPLDELEEVMVHALKQGHTLVWDGDVSEATFSQKTLGYAFLPKAADQKVEAGTPEPEAEVTQESRQAQFDDFRTTDDHLMHMVGLSRDQAGNLFFLTKNSWGEKNGPEKGMVHISRAFVRAKTVAILVHRKAIPAAIARKLGL